MMAREGEKETERKKGRGKKPGRGEGDINRERKNEINREGNKGREVERRCDKARKTKGKKHK